MEHNQQIKPTITIHAADPAALDHALGDSAMSYRAIGILAELGKKARQGSPRTSLAELASVHREGRDAVIYALRELEDAGYLTRERRHENGRLAAYWTVQTPQRP